MKNLIQLKNIYKSYYLSNWEEIPVLKWIDIEVKKWEFVSLMWESGGWKSTLLNIIWFLHPASSGNYIFEWEDISNFAQDENILAYIRNRKIWFIFQQYFLLPRLNAIENVILPAIYAWIDNKTREQKAEFYLEQVWLSDKMFNKPSELSWWQQQRVAIARALVNEPELILADEPTGALDSKTSNEIMELIVNLNKQWKTIIMVTHTSEIAKYASRIIFLKDGKVVDCNYKLK